MKPTTTPLRWAVVGTGSISEQMTADLLLTDNAIVTAIASRDRTKARAFADRFNVGGAGTLEDILASSEVDVVYVGTPHATHFGVAKQAMEAGKHVVCEKPAVVTAPELEELIAVAQAAGVFFMEAMWMKFNPAFRELIAQLDAGAIGEVRSVRASFGLPFPRDDSSRWRAEMHGSALLDQGIYPVTLAASVLGNPARVYATGVVRADGVDLSEEMTFGYDDGRFAQLSSSMVEFVDPSASISGERGWVTIPFPFWAATSFTLHQPSAVSFMAEQSFDLPREGNGYVPMLRGAGQAILDGLKEHPWHTWQDALNISRLLDVVRSQIPVSQGAALLDSTVARS